MIFDTKEKAQEAVRQYNNRAPKEFCPLINEGCNKHCVCYQLAQVLESDNGFELCKGFCNNAMFVGSDPCRF